MHSTNLGLSLNQSRAFCTWTTIIFMLLVLIFKIFLLFVPLNPAFYLSECWSTSIPFYCIGAQGDKDRVEKQLHDMAVVVERLESSRQKLLMEVPPCFALSTQYLILRNEIHIYFVFIHRLIPSLQRLRDSSMKIQVSHLLIKNQWD